MNLSTDNDMFLLYVNKVDFLQLPYKYDQTPDGDSNVTYMADVTFNERKIALPQPWNNLEFVGYIQEAIGGIDPVIQRAEVAVPSSSSSAPINEIYDSMVQLSDIDSGLEALKLTQLPPAHQLKLDFDLDLLDRLEKKAVRLQVIQISNMVDLYQQGRQNLIATAAQLIAQNSQTLV